MTSPKKRVRARRRVERTMDDAFAAFEAGELALADKLSRRAVEEGHVNPRIWHDRARIATLLRDDAGAEEALRQAIAIAPGYAEALVDLGLLLLRHDRTRAARTSLERARDCSGSDALLRSRIESGLAELPVADGIEDGDDLTSRAQASAAVHGPRTSRFDWDSIEQELVARGVARLPRCLDLDDRRSLLGECATAAVRWRLDETGSCVVPTPMPARVREFCSELYRSTVPAASRWQLRFGRPIAFGADASAADARSPGSGAEIELTRVGARPDPVARRVACSRPHFPFQALAVLEQDGGGSVRHELIDLRPGRAHHGVSIDLREGDVAIVVSARRIVTVGGLPGLQDVAHRTRAVGELTATVMTCAFGVGVD